MPILFLLSPYLGPAHLTTTADTATMAPFSLSPTHRAGMSSPILASKGGGGGPKSNVSQKNGGFFPYIVTCITCNLTHSVFLIWN